MSIAAQRIHQPMSPRLLGRAPLLSGAAFSQTQYGPFTHTVPPPYRPDYSSQLPYDYTQQQQSGYDGYGLHANYLGQPNVLSQQLGYSAAMLGDSLSGLSSATAQSLQLPSLAQYAQPADPSQMQYRQAPQSNQAQSSSQPEAYYSQGVALPANVAFPYSQAYSSMPAGGSFFS